MERKIADRLIRAAAEEFGIPVSVTYSSLLTATAAKNDRVEGEPQPSEPVEERLVLCPYFWEYQRFELDKSYQAQIPNTGQFHLVICILWSRLGTELAPGLALPNGQRARSGSEYELRWAVDHAQKHDGVPLLHVYRNRAKPSFPTESDQEHEQALEQWKSLKAFFGEWEKDSQGHFKGAFNNYHTLDEFEDLFREHFRDFLASQLSAEITERALVRKVKRWSGNPFRGLHVFEFQHSPIFYGRTKAVGEAMRALAQQAAEGEPFLLVLGASGAGKSSLVRAGILPLLVEPGSIEGVGLWRRAIMRPAGTTGDLFDALAAALLDTNALPELADTEAAKPVEELADQLRENPHSLALRVKDALGAVARAWKLEQAGNLEKHETEMRSTGRAADAELAKHQREQLAEPRARLALVVDQLEELFIGGFTHERQQLFIAAIASLVRSGRVFVLTTLRSDFYARYQEFPELLEMSRPQGKFDLRPPSAPELGSMIRRPAESAGLSFEVDAESGQRLDEALRDAAIGHPEALPLLEHALEQLFETQQTRGDDWLRWADYRALGGLEGALAKHAETTFQKLRPHEQEAFPMVMRQLVTLGQGEEEVPNRRTAPYRDFCLDDSRRGETVGAQGFVDQLIKNRLLVADADPNGEVVISIAHEALLRHWDRVKEWLTTNREFLRRRDRLDASLKLWQSRGKQKADLLAAGLALAEAETLVRDFRSSLNEEQTDYVRASLTERHRQRRRRNLIRNGILAAVSLLALVAGFQWLRAEKERRAADEQRQRAETAAQVADLERKKADSQRQLAEDNRGVFYLSQAAQTYAAWKNGNIGMAQQLLNDSVAPAHGGGVTDLRGWEWYFVQGLCDLSASGTRVLTGHTGAVLAVVEVPYRKQPVIASAGFDCTVRLWDVVTGKEIRKLAEEKSGIGLGFSYNQRESDHAFVIDELATGGPAAQDGRLKPGDRIVSVGGSLSDLKEVTGLTLEKMAQAFKGDEGTKVVIEVDHAEKGQHERVELTRRSFSWKVQHNRPVNILAASPDGMYLASRDADNQIFVWNLETGHLFKTIQIPQSIQVLGMAFSPDRHWLAVCAAQTPMIGLWDLSDMEAKPVTLKEESPVTAIAFAVDGRLASVSESGAIHFWDLEKGEKLAMHLEMSFSTKGGQCTQVGFSPDGHLLVAGDGFDVQIFDLDHPDKAPRMLGTIGCEKFAFHPTGNYLATAGADGVARVWDTQTGKEVRTLRGHSGPVWGAVFLNDRMTLATVSFDASIRLWDLRRVARENKRDILCDAEFGPCFSTDGRYIAYSNPYAKQIRILDASDGRPLRSIPGAIYRTEFLPSSSLIAVPNEKSEIELIDVTTGKPAPGMPVFRGHRGAVWSIAFSADGKRFVSGGDDTDAFIWEVQTGKPLPLPKHQENSIRAVAFSPDGKWAATSALLAPNQLRIWDANSGSLLHEFTAREATQVSAAWCLRFSPDSKLLVIDDSSGRLHCINPASGEEEKLLVGHTGAVIDAVFSPDGRRLISIGVDLTKRLWDVKTGRGIFVLDDDETFQATSAAFSRDGLRLAVGSKGHLKLWDAAILATEGPTENWSFYAARGSYQEELSNWPEAIDAYDKALEMHPGEINTELRRATSYAELGKLDQAVENVRAVLHQAPENTNALDILGILLLAQAKLSEYQEICQKCAQIALANPNSETTDTAAWLRCLVAQAPGDPKELLNLVEKMATERPEDYPIRNTLGALLYRSGEYQQSISTLHIAMKLLPVTSTDPGSSDKALDHDKDGTAFDWIFLAMAHVRLGQQEEAEKWLKQVADRLQLIESDPIARDPNYQWYWRDIAGLKALYQEAEMLIKHP